MATLPDHLLPSLQEYVERFMLENLGDDEEPPTLEEALEAIWCNVRDDKPNEYFQGHALGYCTLEEITDGLSRIARAEGVAW